MFSLAVPWPRRPMLGSFHVLQARALAARGIEMVLATPKPAIPDAIACALPRLSDHAARPERYVVDGVRIHTMRTLFAHPPFVRRQLTERLPGLVTFGLRLAARRAARRVLDEVAPKAILAHGVLPWAQLVTDLAREAKLPVIFLEHSADDVLRLRRGSALARAWLRGAQQAQRVWVVGPQMQEHLATELDFEASLLPNGAVASPGDVRAWARTEPREGLHILSAGNYYRRKGFEELVYAFADLAARDRSAHLEIVTNAPELLRRRVARSSASKRIVLRSRVPRALLRERMRDADLFVLPSWNEAFGLVYAEALALGLPVVACQDSGFAHYAARWRAAGGGTAISTAPARDASALADVLAELARDPALRRAQAQSGAEMVRTWFTWERNAELLASSVAGVL